MSDATDETTKLVLCPYCGHAQHGGDRCQDCKGLFEPLSRRATQLAMGPWQVRDKNNPFRPGCCYDVIKRMATAGKLKPTTVMRGPTTRQFWSVARNVPGISHLIGYCHACGKHVSPSDAKCGDCGAVFKEPRERNVLGLAYKSDEEAELGQKMLDAEMKGEVFAAPQAPGLAKPVKPRAAKPGDLLADVLDLSGDVAGSPAGVPGARAPAAANPGATGPSVATVIQPTQPGAPTAPMPVSGQPQAAPPSATSAFDIDPTGEVPQSGGISPVLIGLVIANVLALGVIIIIYMVSQS